MQEPFKFKISKKITETKQIKEIYEKKSKLNQIVKISAKQYIVAPQKNWAKKQ